MLAYTSGSVVGHICALFAGYFGARRSSQRGGVLAGAAIMATYGSGIARLSRLRRLALVPLVILVPIVHFFATIALVSSLGALGGDVS